MRKIKKPSVCLTTYFDDNFKDMGEMCLKSAQKYAEKYGFKIELLNSVKSNRPVAWNKILIVKELLEKYDFVFWIDSDALFVRFDKNILKEIENGKDFYLVKHHIRGRLVPNSGSFIIRKSEWSKKFLDDVWNKKEYIYHNYWENAAIVDILGYKEVMSSNKYKLFFNMIFYKLKIKKFATKVFNLLKKLLPVKNKIDDKSIEERNIKMIRYYENPEIMKKVKWLDLEWNNLPGVKGSEAKKPIINHYPAKPYAERLYKMKQDFKNAKLG
ncbi:MAG: hypothetical protein AABX03_04610 [Nanoarchaeota archaeon]